MLLLRMIDLLALVALLVQTFVAWVLVAVFASIANRQPERRAARNFLGAFTALAVGLSSVSFRFLAAQAPHSDSPARMDGSAWAISCYLVYFAGKACFCLYLIRGCLAVSAQSRPRWLTVGAWPLVVLFCAVPLVVADVNSLLILQAPLMVFAACASLWALKSSADGGQGLRLVRAALVAMTLAWLVHAVNAACHDRFQLSRTLLALNSTIDLGVQLLLGIGLIIGVMQEADRRARQAELERERLQREVDRDEKLRALGTLVSGVAHELNNPLTVILGYCDLLGGADHPDAPGRIVREQAERCRGIVRNLSAVAGQSLHPREPIDARELALRVVRGIAPERLIDGRGIEVAAPAGILLAADRIGMEQVLTNLVVNALQASPPRGVVRIGASSDSRHGVEFTVVDDGPGVPTAIRERLFEPFFTTKGPGEGTGLGLAIAHAIVRAHGGSIRVEDGPTGRGACFRVTLPHATPATPAPPAARGANGRSLLVIDDDLAVRSIISRQAQRRGWTVCEAASAEEALVPAFGADRCDAVICDVRMPGIGGAGFHDRLLREQPALLERTLFVTGEIASADAVRFGARCRRPIVQKPFDYDELFAALTACAAPSRAS